MLDAHPLGGSALVKDKRGICHQLANEDRLKWTK
ncbi:ABC-three component system protein [Mesorhizobium metallidurans]